jgi:hypothetical protein
MRDVQQRFFEAAQLARDYLNDTLTGSGSARQVLLAYCSAGAALTCGDADLPSVFMDEALETGRDALLPELLAHCGVILVDDPPRRTAHPLKWDQRALLIDNKVRALLASGLDPDTGNSPPLYGAWLTRQVAAHANAFHVGRRRVAFLALLRDRNPAFLPLLARATGIRA